MNDKYLRIGTTYYKNVTKPLLSEDSVNILVQWSKSELATDYGKEFIKKIPRYDGFCLIPSHTNHRKVITVTKN